MDAERQLRDLYEQWRRLSLREGAAIEAADWPALEQCQSGKASLQPLISAARTTRSRQLERATHGSDAEAEFQTMVRGLLDLERANEAVLQARLRQTWRQQAEFTQTSRRLKRLQAAYAPGERLGWQSYS